MNTHKHERIAYVLQGGGALGAYQVGVINALYEKNYCPHVVSGISIGAINAAIIAGNPRETCLKKLDFFWDTISPRTLIHSIDNYTCYSKFYNEAGAVSAAIFGQPGFFNPRLIPPLFISSTVDKLSFYDTDELYTTLENCIDFEYLNSKKMHLYLGVVNVKTGDFTFFSNIDQIITAEHIMASAAFPPAFPSIKMGNNFFWDGGIYFNNSLMPVLGEKPEYNTLCFAINCFKQEGKLPTTMDQIDRRIKQIHYSGHLKESLEAYTHQQNLRAAITYLGEKLPENLKNSKKIKKILELGSPKFIHFVNIVYSYSDSDNSSLDYNFYRNAIDAHKQIGHTDAMAVLKQKAWEKESHDYMGAIISDAPNNPEKEKTHET